MVFTEEDKALSKNVYVIKGYGARRHSKVAGFSGKERTKSGLNKLFSEAMQNRDD